MSSALLVPLEKTSRTDVVGIEVGGAETRLLRVAKTSGGVEIVAAGTMAAVPLRTSANVTTGACLQVPRPLCAPHAAIVVETPSAPIRLISLKDPPERNEAAALTALFGASPPAEFRAGFAELGADGRGEHTYLACGLPEYLATQMAGLLPETRRPTPASLQLSAAARLNAFALGPCRRHASEGILSVRIEETLANVAVFNSGRLVAYRQFPVGNMAVVAQVAQRFGLSNDLAVELLNENQIDPSTATVPVLTPLFRQIGMSTDLVARRDGYRVQRAFLSGTVAGMGHWLRTAESVLSIDVEAWMPFDDHRVRPHALPRECVGRQTDLIAALGAALALLGDK